MDCSASHKYYHVHEFDPIHFIDSYFSPKADKVLLEEAVINPIKYLHNEKVSGRINGRDLLDISAGPILFPVLAICDCFKEITILEINDSCISELEKWRNNHEEACDWSHASKFLTDLEGRSGGWKEKEELLRGKIKQILKCDFTKDNPTDPVVLSKADCVFCGWVLDIISPDKEAFISNLKKVSSLLKLGGRLILFGNINYSYFFIGEHKYKALTYDEEFLRKTLKDEGYIIESHQANESKASSHIIDHEKAFFVNAIKEK